MVRSYKKLSCRFIYDAENRNVSVSRLYFFNYGPLSPQKDLKSQIRTIVAQAGMNLAPTLFLPGYRKEKIEKKPTPDMLIMDNLEILMATTVDKTRGKKIGAIVDRFIKPKASTIFIHPVYPLYEPGKSMGVSGPHEEFSNIDFRIWIGGGGGDRVFAAYQSVYTKYGGP